MFVSPLPLPSSNPLLPDTRMCLPFSSGSPHPQASEGTTSFFSFVCCERIYDLAVDAARSQLCSRISFSAFPHSLGSPPVAPQSLLRDGCNPSSESPFSFDSPFWCVQVPDFSPVPNAPVDTSNPRQISFVAPLFSLAAHLFSGSPPHYFVCRFRPDSMRMAP